MQPQRTFKEAHFSEDGVASLLLVDHAQQPEEGTKEPDEGDERPFAKKQGLCQEFSQEVSTS